MVECRMHVFVLPLDALETSPSHNGRTLALRFSHGSHQHAGIGPAVPL